MVLFNVLVCSSVCLPDFSESGDARDLGPMTLFVYHLIKLVLTFKQMGKENDLLTKECLQHCLMDRKNAEAWSKWSIER